MNQRNVKIAAVVAAILSAVAVQAQATIVISEVSPWSSGGGLSPYGADWFELTNTGSSAVTLTGWKMDDSSNSFAASVALTGVSSIAAGQSVIFIEGASSINATFINTWFGTNQPAGLTIGNYSGSGVGLSQAGDAVNIFNSSGVLQAGVVFGASDTVAPLQTFDNAAGLTGAISQLSVTGVNGAFVAANDLNEIGSPGTIAPVPEPSEYAMMLAGLAVVGAIARRRQLSAN